MTEHNGGQRTIGFWGATRIGVGAIIGGGILALAGVAFSLAGASAIVAVELNGVIAFITALSFAEMASTFPESGSSYTFTKKVLSVRSAFAIGWILWFASILAGALYAFGFSSYAVSAVETIWRSFGADPPLWLNSKMIIVILSSAAIAFYTIMLTKKPAGGGKWETIGKIALFLIFILAGLLLLPKQTTKQIQEKISPFWSGGFLGMLQAMGYTFIILQGFDLIPAVAGEVRDPKRNIPFAIFVSLGIALVIYIPFLFIIATLGVPAGETILSLSRSNPETLVAVAAGNFLGPAGYWLVVVAAILSMLTALHANLLAASRIAHTMSNDRTLPRHLGVLNEETGIPTRALYITSGILLLSILFIPNLAAAGAAASLIFLISFTLTHITTILARLRTGGLKKKLHARSLPLIPLTGAACCLLLAVFQSIAVPAAGKIVIFWLALGFIIYFSMLSTHAEIVDAMKEALNPNIIKLRGRTPLVLVPLANPSHAKAMVEVATALTPPDVGRALLLSVVTGDVKWKKGFVPAQLVSTQDVIQEALTASYTSSLAPEALITIAPQPWPEIIRVAHSHNCESLLLGLGITEPNEIDPEVERVLITIDSDIVFLKAPSNWQLSNSKRILVPVGGKSGHDELRARLLTSLCRSMEREVTFLRVLPEESSDKDLLSARYKLSQLAEDELPILANKEIVKNNNVVNAIREFAEQSNLIILGVQRISPKMKVFGDIALKITNSVQCATILISKKG